MNLLSKNRLASALGLICLCSVSMGVMAQSAEKKESGTTVGVGMVVGPEYSGASKTRVGLLPFFSYRNANGFYAGMEGIGYGTKLDSFTLSGGLGYRGGRSESKETFGRGSDSLKGMGDIPGALTARFKAAYQLNEAVSLSLGSEMALNHRETGNTYDLGMRVALHQSMSDQFSLNLGARYGDRKFNQSNYGVSAAQSAASGFKAFNAGAGFEQVSSSVNWNHVIDKNWSVSTRVGVTHLLGDAADSPLVKKKTSPTGMFSVNYSF